MLGWFLGVVVNYISDVLPYKRRLAQPFCIECGLEQPLVGYIFWPRKCPSCGTRRNFRTWIVELLFVSLAVWMWNSPPESLGFWIGILLLAYFAVIVVIDLEHRLIMHPVSIIGAIIGLTIGIWFNGLSLTVLGGLAGFGTMFVFYLGGILFAKIISRIKKTEIDEEALGFGDVNLSGVLGLILGWPVIFAGLFLAILGGAIISLLFMFGMVVSRRYQSFVAIPYGPFLIAGAVILLYFRGFILANFGQ